MSLDQLFWARPMLGYADYRGPLPGLYHCGAGAHPGGGVTGAPGHNAAHAILADRAPSAPHMRDAASTAPLGAAETAMAASAANQEGGDAMPSRRGRRPIEDRIRAIEDRLEIYNLIASHPPSADTGAQPYIQSIFIDDARARSRRRQARRRQPGDLADRAAARARQAIKGGLAHFAGLPHVAIDGDRAVVTSYLQILAPHPTADEIEVPGHGASRGYRIHRVGANRWELERTPQGWKIKRRTYRTLDGSDPALDILRQAVTPPSAAPTPDAAHRHAAHRSPRRLAHLRHARPAR